MRKAARIDANQNEIVSGLRKLGCSVWITSSLGKGGVDIVAGVHGRNFMIEIKDGSKCQSQCRLTPLEDAFHRSWQGQICVIKNMDEAKELLQTYGCY